MNPFARTRPFPIALAAAGLLLAVHGAQAASDEADVAHAHLVGRMPLRDACPAADLRDLADELVPAWDAADKPSSVEVDFKLLRQHVYDVKPATGSPAVYHEIRRAVYGLPCDGGDDQPHAVRFVVRFVDGDDDTRLATISRDDAGGAPGR